MAELVFSVDVNVLNKMNRGGKAASRKVDRRFGSPDSTETREASVWASWLPRARQQRAATPKLLIGSGWEIHVQKKSEEKSPKICE